MAVSFVVLGSTVAATTSPGHLRTTTVVVQPGQTLWGIAAKANPRGDVRDTMTQIERLNALSGPNLQIGTELAVPVYGH